MIDFKQILGLTGKPLTGMDCVIRLGLPGSGKTLDQTMTDVLPHLLAGEQVYSTYWINWNKPNLHLFNEFEEVENLRNCVIVFDEIGQILPARQWELEGLRVQLFWQLHRHRKLTLIGNTQDVSLVSKTVGIVANRWYYCENRNNLFIDFLFRLFKSPTILVRRTEMSYQGLKKMANGWELDGVVTPQKRDKHKTKWFPVDKLLAKDLNQYKIELVHKYCPMCQMRQGSQILKENTLKECNYNAKRGIYTLKSTEFCPKHQETQLQVRLSAIYDTDYEPVFPEKVITFQPMIDSPKGYTKIKFQGRLSDNQSTAKELLKKAYKG